MASKRLAVVLMNLGGPDSLKAVRPFLKNLFSDPAIIQLPNPLRALIAYLISSARNQKAQKIYQEMGGASPILFHTKEQQLALYKELCHRLPYQKVGVFVAMRYWHPFTQEVVEEVKAFCPTEIVLLPLYPQFSTTTTGSSFSEWYKQAKRKGVKTPTRAVGSYPGHPSFIEAHVDLLKPWIKKASAYGNPRILFSAHGLPQKVINAGDPYENHVHQTVKAVSLRLSTDTDCVVCYQSKVGPLKWLGPSTEDEINRAAQDKVPLIIVPVSFVSEHAETLVELDNDYRRYAESLGIPFFGRVPALGSHPSYIQALADLVLEK